MFMGLVSERWHLHIQPVQQSEAIAFENMACKDACNSTDNMNAVKFDVQWHWRWAI